MLVHSPVIGGTLVLAFLLAIVLIVMCVPGTDTTL